MNRIRKRKILTQMMFLPDGCEPINATIPGSVWKVLIEEGQEVKKGDTVAVLESMKMEFLLRVNTAE